MDRKLNISVAIEGIQLPLTVNNAEEEKIYRDAASSIQGRIKSLRSIYPDLKNEKYYYVMAMLNTAVESIRSNHRSDTQPLFDKLNELEAEIDKVTKN